jgi:hypothetical protein
MHVANVAHVTSSIDDAVQQDALEMTMPRWPAKRWTVLFVFFGFVYSGDIYAVLSFGGVDEAVDVARAGIARKTGLDADHLSCTASPKSDWKTSLFPNFLGVKYWDVLCDMQVGNKLIGGSVVVSPVLLAGRVYDDSYDLSWPHLPSQNITLREFPAKIRSTP